MNLWAKQDRIIPVSLDRSWGLKKVADYKQSLLSFNIDCVHVFLLALAQDSPLWCPSRHALNYCIYTLQHEKSSLVSLTVNEVILTAYVWDIQSQLYHISFFPPFLLPSFLFPFLSPSLPSFSFLSLFFFHIFWLNFTTFFFLWSIPVNFSNNPGRKFQLAQLLWKLSFKVHKVFETLAFIFQNYPSWKWPKYSQQVDCWDLFLCSCHLTLEILIFFCQLRFFIAKVWLGKLITISS